jgi:ubiquitin carboxyl-terminal hydrolase 48
MFDGSEISSKDAYMLVYTRKDSPVDCNGTTTHKPNGDDPKQANVEPTIPPPRVLDVINSLNAAHDEACEAHVEKSEQLTSAIHFHFDVHFCQRKRGQITIR